MLAINKNNHTGYIIIAMRERKDDYLPVVVAVAPALIH